MILAGGLIALLGLGYSRARPLFTPRVLLLPGVLLIAYATVETGSRGGLLALIAGLVTLFLARRENVWGRLRSGAIAVAILGVIGAFQYFVVALLIGGRNGDPQGSTLFYTLHFYRQAFVFNDMGYASVLAIVLFVIVMILTTAIFYFGQKAVYYAGSEA